MTKIVLNNCFGGFSLSVLALVEIAKQDNDRKLSNSILTDISKYEIIEIIDNIFITDYFVFVLEDDKYYLYSQFLSSNDYYIRTNPILVSVVEKLGILANGSTAELKIETSYSSKGYVHSFHGNETLESKPQNYFENEFEEDYDI